MNFTPSEGMYSYLLVFFYILALRNIWAILISKINPSAALSWILVNLLLPFIGVPLYFLLGQNRIRHYYRRMQRRVPQGGRLRLPPEASYNQLRLLSSGAEAFDEIFSAIQKAQNFVLIQYYIFRTDKLGIKFIDLLIEQSRKGVKVYFLYDNFGSLGLNFRQRRRMKEAGIEVVPFLPFSLRFNLQVNFRNHRKAVIIDGHTCYLGGMNVGEEYLGVKRKWRDTQLHLQGPACQNLAETFADDWAFAAPQSTQAKLENILQTLPKGLEGESKCMVHSFGPGDQSVRGLYLFMNAIQKAQGTIQIASPYFIPDLILERCLELALAKGIRVKLLVPARPDSGVVRLINYYYIRRMCRKGAEVYLYQAGFMHQKVMLIDQSIAIIGTSNFDNRSMYLNFETSVAVEDSKFCEEVELMLQSDYKNSQLLTNTPQSHFSVFAEGLSRLLAPLF